MESKVVDNRILLLLAKKWKEKGTGGPYRTSMLYKGYSDLDDDYIDSQLSKLSTRGLITFTADKNGFYLADKGLATIQSFLSNDRWNSVGI